MSREFLDTLRAHGLEPPATLEPGKLYRFPGLGKGRGNTAGWCKLFPDGLGGAFGDFSQDVSETWQAKKQYTPEEREAFRRQVEEARRQRERKEATEAARVRERLSNEWDAAQPESGAHRYLREKGVGAYGIRTNGYELLIPVRDSHGVLHGVQAISPSGDKKLRAGTQKQGGYFAIGKPNGRLYVCEGYATGASVYEATGDAVAVALDCGNLLPVAEVLRRKYPNLTLVIAADNDTCTEGNPGVTKATQAAREVNALLAVPTFQDLASKPTDFNDLHQLEGFETVRQQMEEADLFNPYELKGRKPYTPYRVNNDKGLDESYPTHTLHQPCTNSPLEALPSSPSVLVHHSEKGPKLKIASEGAREVTKALRGRFAYEVESGIWHVFTGAHWKAEITAKTLYAKLTHWMYEAAGTVGFTPRYMDSALLLIQRLNSLPLPERQRRIPFKNGLLNPDSRELAPVTPDNALTWALPFEYSPTADCPTIQHWLHLATGGDEGTVQLLRALMAALLRRPSKYQKFLHIVGPGGTGKSTFIRLLKTLVGDKNVCSTDLRRLEQNRFETALLYGKRLAIIADTDKYGGVINVLKNATGEDPLPLEIKHKQQSGSFIFEGLVLMASNEALKTSDYSSGLERRRVTVRLIGWFPVRKKPTGSNAAVRKPSSMLKYPT